MSASETGVASHLFGLGSSLSIREVQDLRARLLAAVEVGPDVLDGSAVERADSAGLQLLIALGRSLAVRGESLVYSGASEALVDAARTLGLSAACGLPGAGGAAHGS